jgi:hypothetical protein
VAVEGDPVGEDQIGPKTTVKASRRWLEVRARRGASDGSMVASSTMAASHRQQQREVRHDRNVRRVWVPAARRGQRWRPDLVARVSLSLVARVSGMVKLS